MLNFLNKHINIVAIILIVLIVLSVGVVPEIMVVLFLIIIVTITIGTYIIPKDTNNQLQNITPSKSNEREYLDRIARSDLSKSIRNTASTKHYELIKRKKEYLLTTEWKVLASERRRLDHYTCQRCKTTEERLEVHHITYIRLGAENMDDLVSLCRKCHEAVHMALGYSYTTIYPINIVPYIKPKIMTSADKRREFEELIDSLTI